MDNLPCSLIIPAAGESKRFADAGILKPKGLLAMSWMGKNQTMIEHVIPPNWRDSVRVVVRQSQYSVFRSTLPIDIEVVGITNTRGQADTCRQGCIGIRGDFIVINSDNAFDYDMHGFIRSCREEGATLGAVVFKSDMEPRYGYVSDYPYFEFGMEKAAISPWALAGVFYFKSAPLLANAFHQLAEIRGHECYLSELFTLIEGKKLAYKILRRELHEWGTPIDLMADRSVEVTDSSWDNRV